MPARRRLKADEIRIETDADVVFYYDAYTRMGSIARTADGRWNHIPLTDQALDDLYEALKAREAHKQFLAVKYGADA